MSLVKHSEDCDSREEENCDLQFKVLAPIYVQNRHCRLYWQKSEYSVDGHTWIPFQKDPGEFSLQFSKDHEKTLKVRFLHLQCTM